MSEDRSNYVCITKFIRSRSIQWLVREIIRIRPCVQIRDCWSEDFIGNEVIAGILTGDVTSANWNHKAEKVDFCVVKVRSYSHATRLLRLCSVEPLTDVKNYTRTINAFF